MFVWSGGWMIAKSTNFIVKSVINYSDVTETGADLAVPTIFLHTVIELWKLLFITFMIHFAQVKVLVILFELSTVSEVLDEPWLSESSMVGVTVSPVTSVFKTSRVETWLIESLSEISAFVTSGVEAWMLPELLSEMDSALSWFWSIFVEGFDNVSLPEDSFILMKLYCETSLY